MDSEITGKYVLQQYYRVLKGADFSKITARIGFIFLYLKSCDGDINTVKSEDALALRVDYESQRPWVEQG